MSTRATLSVCLIVKDEESLLGSALASVSFADEIVIGIDSRTQDRTEAIAREHGARVHHFDWGDDFSAARNIGLRRARRDWILIIDADDRVTDWGAAQIAETLRRSRRDIDAYGFQIQNRRLDETVQEVDVLPSIRLFPNHRGIHYENRVHEVLRAKDGSALRLGWLRGGHGLVHYGYDPDIYRVRQKAQRNLALLGKQIQEHPRDRLTWFELTRQFLGIGHYGQAREAARVTLALPGRLRPELIAELEKIVALDETAMVRT